MAEITREDLGVALSLWDGDFDSASLYDALVKQYPSNMARELVRGVEQVKRDFRLLTPDLNFVEDVQEKMERFLAVYPEVPSKAQQRLASGFCMESR